MRGQRGSDAITMASPNFVANCGTVTGAQHGTTGATARKYKVVCVAEDGTEAAASAEVTIADGNATLSETDHIALTWTAVAGAASYKVYRTLEVGALKAGYIGPATSAAHAFDDTGIAASETDVTPSAANGTGLGTATNTNGWLNKTVQFTGTFVATIQMQGSMDGTTWLDEGTAATAVGKLEVTPAWVYMRCKMTGYTSGDPIVFINGN